MPPRAKHQPGGKKTGRPAIWDSVDGMQEKIDAYFVECEGKPFTKDDGEPLIDKWGNPVYIGQRPPTVTGLALALGFISRMSLIEYQGDKEFTDTITRAKARIEDYVESRLFDKDGSNGAKFSLSNNFKGWKEKQEIDMTNKIVIFGGDSELED
jgi:hypothetical protein